MNKKIIGIFILGIFLISNLSSVSAVSINKEVKNRVIKQSPALSTNVGSSSQQAEWTVMLYMCADNDLGYYGYGQHDIDKLRAATQNDDSGDVNIIVLYDKYGNGNSKIKSIKDGFVEDLDDNESVIPENNEVNMGDPQTLVNFGAWTIENYPANHYMFVLWGHGFEAHPSWTWPNSDWFYTACVDVTSKDSIRIANYELVNALDSITNHGAIKFDIIGFDTGEDGEIMAYFGFGFSTFKAFNNTKLFLSS
ncbi:Peptidase C11, clostripain [Thermoplasmatales archaeon SCGC AB-539-N05]|nr:Peptidase C11, clostripain [Thermoplasmatales archaeon SCGC AB-539-N05]